TTPVRPIRWSGSSARRSPSVVTRTSSTSAPKRAATHSAWTRASALARVATRRRATSGLVARAVELVSDGIGPEVALVDVGVGGDAEEPRQRVGEQLAPAGAGRVLHAHGGLVQELVDEASGEGLDGCERLGIELLEPAAMTFELREPELLAACPEPGDERGHRAGRA